MTFRDESDGNSVLYYANIGSLGLSEEVDRFLMRNPNLKQLGGKVLFLYATLIHLLRCPQFQLKFALMMIQSLRSKADWWRLRTVSSLEDECGWRLRHFWMTDFLM